MPTTKPADLCTQLLPTGKLCRGIALRNHRYCRSHIQTYRLLERERQHEEAMFHLQEKLNLLEFPALLQVLDLKLNSIRSIVRTYPEARLTLANTIDRIREILAPAPDSIAEIKHIPATSPESNT